MEARMLWGPWDNFFTPPYEPYYQKPQEKWLRDAMREGIHNYTPSEPGIPYFDGVSDIGESLMDIKSNILTRYYERIALDKRAAEYLNMVEGQTAGPASFTT